MKATIKIERPLPSVAKVVFNQPDTGNRYDDETIVTLITALDDLLLDPELKAIWLAAEGTHFSLGPSAHWLEQRTNADRAEQRQEAQQLKRLLHTLYLCPIPIVATVQGQAHAAAVGWLCCCDVVLACERSHFLLADASPEGPALQMPYLLKTIGERATRYYALTNELMDGNTALKLGLVTKLVPSAELNPVAEIVLRKLILQPKANLANVKAAINETDEQQNLA